MLSLSETIVTAILVMTASLLFMVAINRIWPVSERYAKEDLIGWQLNILATTHAVILGFMLYTEWTNFTAVKLNVEQEASALTNVFRLAEGLPAAQRARLEDQARRYAQAVLSSDWPLLSRGETPELSHLINQSMWKTLMSVKAATPAEITAEDHALSELSAMTQYRRTRLLQSDSRLPVIFWWVLVVGGVLTIVSVGMFGSRNMKLHAFQVFSLTLLLTLAMLAIAELDRPFAGWIHIDPYPYARALHNMHEIE
jgi:hypothetical protein